MSDDTVDSTEDKASQWFEDVTLVCALNANPMVNLNAAEVERYADAAARLLEHAGFDLAELANRGSGLVDLNGENLN
ncbi:MAG: hypothetical protein ACO38N_12025 [Candidatus Nanopelagicales bacterium]